MTGTKKWEEFDRFYRGIYGGCGRGQMGPMLGGDQKTVDKILELLKANGLDPEAVAAELRTLVGDDFAFVEGVRHQVGDDRWANWKKVRYEQLLFPCYKLWPNQP